MGRGVGLAWGVNSEEHGLMICGWLSPHYIERIIMNNRIWIIYIMLFMSFILVSSDCQARVDNDCDQDVDGIDLQVMASKDGDSFDVAAISLLYGASDLQDACLKNCEATNFGSATVQTPVLIGVLKSRWREAWLASPIVADLDSDGIKEILVPRHDLLLGWHMNGELIFNFGEAGARIWASPLVADFVPSNPGLEVAVASGSMIYLLDAQANLLPGFPVIWRYEMRSLAAGDIDGDGDLELVGVTTSRLAENGESDIIMAFHHDGSAVAGYPPNTSGSAGCDGACYVFGGFDQNLAIGDVDGDGVSDIFSGQDIASLSLHRGNGEAFDCSPVFNNITKFMGIRFFHDFEEAKQGWTPYEETALMSHFTTSAPAIADIDGDGMNDLVILGSVKNAAQTDRLKGVALWVLHNDGTRLPDWQEPFHFPDYLAGLWDYIGTNMVSATNQVSVADINSNYQGLEMIFAGFDGKIHAVSSTKVEVWNYTYTADNRVLTGGVVIADLSGDGLPEIIFTSYSPDQNKSHLFILNNNGDQLHRIPLPKRGAMPVPTIDDVDGNGTLEIVISLKDGEDDVQQVLVYEVPGSAENCLPWPTGRGNYLRNGYVENRQ